MLIGDQRGEPQVALIEYSIDPAVAARYRELGWWRDLTILDDFRAAVESRPDRVAIASYHVAGRTERISFRELDQYVMRTAGGLVELGIAPGDVVSLQLPNWWQFAVVHLACAQIGAVTNPMLPILREREVSFILERTSSAALIVPDTFRGFRYADMALAIQASSPLLRQVLVVGPEVPFGAIDFMAHCIDYPWDEVYTRERLDSRRAPADGPGQIQFTSGTTGEPKGVVHTYNTLALCARVGTEILGITPDDVMHMPSPLAHNTGFIYGMSMPLMWGMTAVFQDQWSADEALRIIAEEKVTVMMGSTVFLTDLCAAYDPSLHDVSSLRMFICGGAPIPPVAVEMAQDKLGIMLIASWGMTENGMATATRPDDSPEKVAGTDGAPVPWVQVKTVDDKGVPVGTDVPGRLLTRAASSHVTYLGRPDLYEAAMLDGWFDSGDIARIDSDGYIRICGRVKDLIIRGGENIPALEVEAVLLTNPLIKDVAVVGIPDARFGERACAVVVPADRGPDPTLEDLKATLRGAQMSKTFWPESIVIRSELPRTASGKVQKFQLREEIKDATDLKPTNPP
jgi:cyclohexanecarboxylate-CoA ligase